MVAAVRLGLFDSHPITLNNGELPIETIEDAAKKVNEQLIRVERNTSRLLEVFEVFDLRMLSGLIGELFSSTLASLDERLQKNPNIDGYPDLCDISATGLPVSPEQALHFDQGGLEVKNTFGLQRRGFPIDARQGRRALISKQLVWKAHHPTTNHLLALQSDYVNRIPQIVSIFFSSDLTPSDWTAKQNPKAGSTMTSFCQTKRSALDKLQERHLVVDLNWHSS